MLRNKRNLVLDIYDYAGHKICNLYDSTQDVNGQATDVIVSTERNGWKELSFTIPCVCEDSEGNQEDNYRIGFLKADYRIRLLDDDGEDWYLISEPKITHNRMSKNVSVTAGHISQLLKTKNLGLEFSDEEGNNVGTAEMLLTTILEGTGWSVGNVATFKEKRGGAEKYRSLKASAKTGAFKLITNMCELFEAKPIFHGDTKTVDIVPMNPFSEPENGGPPDIADEKKSKVIELRYGNNVKNVTRTRNTENLVTKLYAYGAFGDKTSGYCGIDEWVHTEYILSCAENIPAGSEAYLDIENPATNIHWKRYIMPHEDIHAGDMLIWSVLDPASMSYVWNERTDKAYPTYNTRKIHDTPPKQLIETAESPKLVTNYFSFLMDFDYYRKVNLLTDEMVQRIAEYQRYMPIQSEIIQNAATEFNNVLNDVSETIGVVNYCKLGITQYDVNEGYVQLLLDTTQYTDGVIYRTDYQQKPSKYFKWHVTDKLMTNGDPLNTAASIVYIFHNTDPMTYHVGYVQSVTYSDEKKEHPVDVTIWIKPEDMDLTASDTDEIYLFESNSIRGRLGQLQSSDESAAAALESTTKNSTVKHPVYFRRNRPDPLEDVTYVNGYAWWWTYFADGTPSEMYLCYRYQDKTPYSPEEEYGGDTSWHRMWFGDDFPSASYDSGDYFFNWSTSVLWHFGGDGWEKYSDRSPNEDRMVSKIGSIFQSCMTRDRLYKGYYQYYTVELDSDLPIGNYALSDEWGTYYAFTTKNALTSEDKIVYDTTNRWAISIKKEVDPSTLEIKDIIDDTLEVKNYRFDNVNMHPANIAGKTIWEEGSLYIDGPNAGGEEDGATGWYRSGFCMARPNILYRVGGVPGNIGVYCYTLQRQFISYQQVAGTIGSFTSPVNTRFIRFTYNLAGSGLSPDDLSSMFTCRADNYNNAFVVEDEEYIFLDGESVGSGELKGIVPLMQKFKTSSDDAYLVKYQAMLHAQDDAKRLETGLLEALGDMYREGYWQKNDYVDGDEEKLYNDGLENLEEIAFPEAKYNVTFLDLYGDQEKNTGMSVTDISSATEWPDLTPDYAVHLVDPEIGLSKWAFIDKLQKCYDKPWRTTMSLNTKLSTIQQHSFTDVMTHIAEVANQVKGKMTIYDRAEAFNQAGKMATDMLEGTLSAYTTRIEGGSSSWYTDDRGAMMFVSADGGAAMMLTGNGLVLASAKNEYGEWDWRTAITGEGMSADVIVTGFLSAERILAGSITTDKVSSDFGSTLNLSSNASVNLAVSSAIEEAIETGEITNVNNIKHQYFLSTSSEYPEWFPVKDGPLTSYMYNEDGKLTSVIENGETTTYEYNEDGQLTTITYPDQTTTTYEYDEQSGLLIEETTAGESTYYSYDEEGRLSTVTRGEDDADVYVYDSETGLLIRKEDGSGAVIETYAYNEDGLMTSSTDANGYITTFEYNSKNKLTSKTYNDQTTYYRYDNNDNLEMIVEPDGKAQVFSYSGTSMQSVENTEIDDQNTDGGYWTDDPPEWQDGCYIWIRSQVFYSDGTTTETEPYCDSSWHAIDDVRAAIATENAAMQNNINSLIDRVSAAELQITQEAIVSTVTESSTYLNGLQDTITSAVEQTKSDLTATFTTLQDGLQNANDKLGTVDSVKAWFNFNNNAVLSIGKSDSQFSMELNNEMLAFKNNGQIMSYFKNNTLYNQSASIEKGLDLGNFKITVAEDGDALVWT